MAAGLAQRMLGGRGEAESAGIAPFGHRAAAETIHVMQQEGIDLSDHTPRQALDLSLREYDYVVTLDSYVYQHVKERSGVAPKKLLLWEIDDPYGQGLDAYQKTFHAIRSHLEDLLTQLGFASDEDR
jgi:arsenate reductase